MRIVMLLGITMTIFIVHQFLNNLLKSYEKAAEIKEGLDSGLNPNEEWYFQNPASIHESTVKIREMRLQALKDGKKNAVAKIAKFSPIDQTEP